MAPALTSSLLSRITTPLVLLNADADILQANDAGQALWHRIDSAIQSLVSQKQSSKTLVFSDWPEALWLFSPCTASTDWTGFYRGFFSDLLKATCPVLLAGEEMLVRATPLPEEKQLLLEWLPQGDHDKLEILQAVSQAVNSSLILEDIFDALNDVLRRFIPYEEAVIVILDDSQNGIKILVRMTHDGDLEISGENNAFAGYDPLLDKLLKDPRSHLFSRTDLPKSVVFSESAATAITVPLINKGLVVGLVALSTAEDGGFYHYHEGLLNQVSAQLAVAVENAKFYWQTRSQASREFLINQLTMAIRQSLDIDVILSTAVMELGKVLGVSRCYIRYFSQQPFENKPARPEKTTPRLFGYHMPGISPVDAMNELDFERRVFTLRKEQPYNPFILNDVRDCPPGLMEVAWLKSDLQAASQFSQFADLDDSDDLIEGQSAQSFFETAQIKSLAVIPILIGEALVGTITLHQCDAFRVWVMEDIDLLNAMAEHLGVALHQASLFARLDEQNRQLENTLHELQQAQVYLIQSEKMAVLGQFVAGIAHEVNTPLGTMVSNNNTLKTIVERLKAENTPASAETLLPMAEELLALNKMASERIQEIVKSLRNFARLDESELKTVNIHEGIDSTLLVMKSTLNPAVRIEKHYDPQLPMVQCYPGLLNQVFMNLLVNATHALDEKVKQPVSETNPSTIRIETRLNPAGTQIEIEFKDTGKGIPPENLAKIFDPGFTTKGAGVGTGLGLALCYRIMEKHKGRMEVHSEVGKGTKFVVILPLYSPEVPLGR